LFLDAYFPNFGLKSIYRGDLGVEPHSSITQKIQSAIEDQVPAAMNHIIAVQANAAFAALTQPINVDHYASINLALATNPVFTKEAIEMSLLGVWGPPPSVHR